MTILKPTINPFTAMMSLENNQLKCKIWNLWLLLSSFSHRHVKGFSSKHIALKADGRGAEIYCLQVCPFIFQPRNFTGWGSEGVKAGQRGLEPGPSCQPAKHLNDHLAHLGRVIMFTNQPLPQVQPTLFFVLKLSSGYVKSPHPPSTMNAVVGAKEVTSSDKIKETWGRYH